MNDIKVKFSKITASNLEGKRFNLPQDLGGGLNILLLAFKMEQQTTMDSWKPFLFEFLKRKKGLE